MVLSISIISILRTVTVFHVRWYVQRGVAVEKTHGLQMKTDRFHRHDGPILGTHNVVGAEGVPDYQVRLFQGPILFDVGRKPVAPLLLVRVVSSRIALRRVVGRDPEMRTCEATPLPLWRSFREEGKRVFFRHELVGNRLAQGIER